jgi:hypothetical protein
MTTIAKLLHALAVALFFGSVAFFTVAGLLMIDAFENVALKTDKERPSWFPIPKMYSAEELPKGLPSPARKEQGSRAFGVAVGSLFPFYFSLQAGCAVVALLTAPSMGGRIRFVLCVLALLVVLGGWGLERYVEALREPRNELTDVVLEASKPSKEQIEQAINARTAFLIWHGVSLLVNFGALGLSGGLAALLAFPRREDGASS